MDVATLSGAPLDGIVLTGTSPAVSGAGLKPGDIIVAINGVRVQKSQQYYYLLDAATSLKIEFGYWSGKDYQSVTIELPKHRLGATISDHSSMRKR